MLIANAVPGRVWLGLAPPPALRAAEEWGSAMHLDLDAYIALGFLVATVVITIGLFAFLLTRRKN